MGYSDTLIPATETERSPSLRMHPTRNHAIFIRGAVPAHDAHRFPSLEKQSIIIFTFVALFKVYGSRMIEPLRQGAPAGWWGNQLPKCSIVDSQISEDNKVAQVV